MHHHGVFKPCKKKMSMTCVSSTRLTCLGTFQSFLFLRNQLHVMLQDFLLKGRELGCPNLVVAFTKDSPTAMCLLQELHSKDSLRHLPMESKPDMGGKAIWKVSFYPFCLYCGSNDMSYMNHIVCGYYGTNYGCGQCLKEVYTTGQQLKAHMKTCACFPKGAQSGSSSLPEEEQAPKVHSPESQPLPVPCSQ